MVIPIVTNEIPKTIPKIIHYCWFGDNPKSALILRCIASWQKYLPAYKIMEWNEQSFNVEANVYTTQAFAHKKWAFVSDYARLHALYNHGGIYLDTDVEIFQSLDIFLTHAAFSGFEKTYKGGLSPITALIGAQKQHALIAELLSYYDRRHFIINNKPDLTTNTHSMSQYLINTYHVKVDDTYQILPHDVHIYPSDYFCIQGKHKNTSYAVHHFDASWKPWHKRMLSKMRAKIMRLIM